jgi:hypothetical protein
MRREERGKIKEERGKIKVWIKIISIIIKNQ